MGATAMNRGAEAQWGRWLIGQCVTALLLAVIGVAALNFTLGEPAVPLFWPASGVALAMTFRLGDITAGVVFVVVALLHLGFGAGPSEAVLLGGATAAAGVIGARLLRHFGFDRRFGRLRDVGLFVVIGAGVSSSVGALGGTLGMVGIAESFPEILGICWAADSIGLLLIGPFLLAVDVDRILPRRAPWSHSLWIAGGALLVLLIYGSGMPGAIALPLSYIVFPYAMLVALRCSPAVTMMTVVAMAAIALSCTAAEKGPFAQAGMPLDVFSLHAHLAMLALTALMLASMRAERDAAETRAREHLAALARAGRLDAMSMMAAGIAHQINQPLCAVSSYAQGARRLLREGHSTAELDRALERIVAGNEKASDIVRRIRTFLRSGEGERATEDARELIRDSVQLIRPEYGDHGVRLETDCNDTALPVEVDAVALRQVLVNLLQNALEWVLVPGARARGPVRIRGRRVTNPDCVEILIEDTGPGLPEGDRERLFEPLVTRRADGTGLGLAIARSLVEAHDGTLTAEDAPGGGALMRIRLPAAAYTHGRQAA